MDGIDDRAGSLPLLPSLNRGFIIHNRGAINSCRIGLVFGGRVNTKINKINKISFVIIRSYYDTENFQFTFPSLLLPPRRLFAIRA